DPDRVPDLALVPVRELALRRPRGDRRGGAAQAAARPYQAAAGPTWRRARLGLGVLPGLRVLQCRNYNWHTPSTYGFLAAGVALLAVFAFWQTRAASPLLPPRVVLDRNRGAAYLAMLIVGAGMFGIFLFLTYYLQQTLGYSPVVSGVAFL